MYYSQQFYRLLQRAFYVNFDEDVLIIVQQDGDDQIRVPYSEMTVQDARAALHYIGMRIRALQEVFKKL